MTNEQAIDGGACLSMLASMAHRVCPWWLGYLLASPLRRWLQDPGAIVGPYVSERMTVLEPGPGMGFFTLELARRVGLRGRVIAIDVQPKMLEVLARRAGKSGLAERIQARQPQGDHLGIDDCLGKVDFALAFAVVHEVPQPRMFLADIYRALRPDGKLLLAEPAGHVSSKEFGATLALAKEVGFALESRPTLRRSHAAMLVKSPSSNSFAE